MAVLMKLGAFLMEKLSGHSVSVRSDVNANS